MRVSVSTLLIALLIIFPPAFAAADEQTSDVTSLYHLANILGIQVSLARIEDTLTEKSEGHRVAGFAVLIDAAEEIGRYQRWRRA